MTCAPAEGARTRKFPAASLVVRAAPMLTPTPCSGSPDVRTKRPATAASPGGSMINAAVALCVRATPSTTPVAVSVSCVVPAEASGSR